MDPLHGIDFTKFGAAGALRELDLFKGVEMAKLTGTSKISEAISKLAADTTAMERFARPSFTLPERAIPQIPTHEPMTYLAPVRAEVRLLADVSETLERMHDDEVRTSEGQINALLEIAVTLTEQGKVLTGLLAATTILANDAKGQKWSRRRMAFFTFVGAVAAVVAALYASGLLNAFNAAAPMASPTPAPNVSPAPAPSLSPAPTITLAPTPLPSTATTPAITPTASKAP